MSRPELLNLNPLSHRVKKPRVLVFIPQASSFIKKDLDILSSVYEVRSHSFQASNKLLTPLRFLSQFFFLLANLPGTRLIVCEFAAYHSFLPALAGRISGIPSLLIIGGNDGHNFPSLRYGNYTKKLLGAFTRWSLLLCSHVAPKHDTLIFCDYGYDSSSPRQQGVKSVIPSFQRPYTVINNGYDPTKWYCDRPKKARSFITVSGALEYAFQFQLKGLDLIVAAAAAFPDATFTILGAPPGYAIEGKPENVILTGALPNEQLRSIYAAHQYYLQLSMAEGFPNALCEAMLCECIPIGSAVFSIPEIIGGTGFVLPRRDPGLLKEILAHALSCDNSLGAAARERIIDHYTIDKRSVKLLELCKKLGA